MAWGGLYSGLSLLNVYVSSLSVLLNLARLSSLHAYHYVVVPQL